MGHYWSDMQSDEEIAKQIQLDKQRRRVLKNFHSISGSHWECNLCAAMIDDMDAADKHSNWHKQQKRTV